MKSLRVLFVTPDLFGPPGGIARVSRLICKALSESAQIEQLNIVALNDAISQKVDHHYLSTASSSYIPVGKNKLSFIKQISRLSVLKHNVFLTSHVNLLWPLWPLYRLNYNQSILVPIVHGIDVWKRLPWFRRFPLADSSIVLSVSMLTKERMMHANAVAPEKVRILPNCLDPNFVHVEGSNVDSSLPCLDWMQKPYILTVSRLSKNDRYKGHSQVIHALVSVCQQLPSLQYYVIGEGDLIPELQQLCEQLGVASSIHFLGRVDELTLGKLYTDADVFVMPSKGEGFGLVFLEAMAHGLPVIASTQDAAGEVVQNGETGLLIDPDDIGALSASLLQLLTNSPLRRQMGKLGQQVASKRFSYNAFKNNLLKYLQEACDVQK